MAKDLFVLNPADARIIHTASFRTGPRQRALEKEEVDQIVKARVAEPATTKWKSRNVFVTKKNERPEFCVDYRRLSDVMERNSYPMSRVDALANPLGEAQMFSTLDAKFRYWQIEI